MTAVTTPNTRVTAIGMTTGTAIITTTIPRIPTSIITITKACDAAIRSPKISGFGRCFTYHPYPFAD